MRRSHGLASGNYVPPASGISPSHAPGTVRRMARRIWLITIATLLAGAVAAPAAGASVVPDLDFNVNVGRSGDRYVLKGPVDLLRGQVARTVIVVDGSVTVRRGATITEDLVVVDGPAVIAGTVRGRVVTLGDRATVTPTGVVGDGIRWGTHQPIVAPGASVGGTTSEIDRNWHLGNGSTWVAVIAWWLAVSISTLLLGALLLWLAPRAAEATAALMRDGGWGPALGVGFVLLIGLPLLALLALVTVVGIPFGIGLLLALAPLAAVGYVTSAWVLGRRMVGPPPARRFPAFLAGWAVLRVAGLVPFLGALVFFVAALFGVGALAWALLRSRREGGVTGGPEAPLAPAI